MLAVRTPGAPQTARVGAAFGSAFPLERQGRLLRSRSISGLKSGNHLNHQFQPLQFPLSVADRAEDSGKFRTPTFPRAGSAYSASSRFLSVSEKTAGFQPTHFSTIQR